MIGRISVIIITSLTISFVVLRTSAIYWPISLCIVLLIEILELLKYQRRLERSVWQFFRSIRNDDHTFKFKVNSNTRILNLIHKEMNRVNTMVKDLRIDQVAREKYYQILLEQVSSGIITINSNGFIELTNQSALRILNMSVLNHIDQLERVDLKLYNHLNDLKPKTRTVVSLNIEQTNHDISVSTQEISVRDESIFVVVLQDIRNELDQKELDTWIKLIRIQAHEIRNSLAPISSVANSLIGSTDVEQTQKGLEIIAERSSHLQKFIESYRQLTHLPSPEISQFDIYNLVDRVKILLSSLPNYQNVKLQVLVDCDNTIVKADQDQITQVLLNILRNSYEALSETNHPSIIIRISRPDKKLKIMISDNGPGIPNEDMEEIFTPFYTTKEEGTGIGLSLSKQIVRKHGGEIFVENNSGGGVSVALLF